MKGEPTERIDDYLEYIYHRLDLALSSGSLQLPEKFVMRTNFIKKKMQVCSCVI